MIKSFSQRLTPPYSGQVQVVESGRARALTMDGETWEIHFLHGANAGTGADGKHYQRSYRRVAYLNHKELIEMPTRSPQDLADVDERIIELARYVASASLPFPAADRFEYWLLDPTDGSPLALIFSCTEAEQIAAYPVKPEWTALPAAVLPIEATEEEKQRCDSPVNYQLEALVARRAGSKPQARWFERSEGETDLFPPCMIREDWPEQADHDLCQRYIRRQAPRLLMLHNLSYEDRLRLEIAAKDHVFEVERFFSLYPDIADEKLLNAMRVEARLRRSEAAGTSLKDRRDGVLYQ